MYAYPGMGLNIEREGELIMKIARKTVATLTAFTLAFSLSACGSRPIPTEESGPPQTGATPSAAQSNTEAGLVPEEGAKLLFWTGDVAFAKAAAAAFEAETGVPVEVEELGLSGVDKISLEGPAGTGADVFMSPHDSFAKGMGSKVFLKIEDSIALEIEGTLSPAALSTVKGEDGYYGIPVSIETSALLYNKTLVEKPADTMEQIMEEAKTFNDIKNNKFYFLSPIVNGYAAFPFLSSQGFRLFGQDGKDNNHPGFDTPEFLNGLEVFQSMHDLIPMSAADLTPNNAAFFDQNFIDGKTAYYPNGTWSIKAFRDAGVDFGVAPMPTLNGKQLTPFSGVQNAHVSVYTKYPAAAQLFARYLVSQEAAGMLYNQAYKITSRTDYKSVSGLKDDADLMVFAEQFSSAIPMPSTARVGYYWAVMDGVLPPLFDGTLTPQKATEKAQADFDALVKSE